MPFDPDNSDTSPLDARLSSLLGSIGTDDRSFMDPPADLWSTISSRVAAADASDSPPSVASTGGNVVDLTARRGRPMLTKLAAVAAAAAVIAGIGVLLVSQDDGPSEQLLAQAELDQVQPLGTTKAAARLVERNGETHLIVEASDMAPAPDGSEYELWLIDPEVTDPKSLGVVTGSGDIVVPPSIDPDDYPIVDISLEPVDGDHQHSGNSLMRGTLA